MTGGQFARETGRGFAIQIRNRDIGAKFSQSMAKTPAKQAGAAGHDGGFSFRL